ncbi:MAG: helix-turn-helix domain-containing protein [Coriobacteriales bacterium]|nr:helix-turn-helix domain-containing protein [Coriobacteriales bacterium]
MRLNDLLARLPEGSIARTALNDPGCDIYTVGFLSDDTKDYRTDVLYFGDDYMLPTEVAAGKQFSCIIYGDPEATTPLEQQGNTNIVWLARDANPYASFNQLVGAFITDQEFTSIIRRLLTAHLSNRGLQYLVEEAATSLGHPIVVVDASYRYIAYHLGDLAHEDSQLSRVMAKELANETLLDEAVAYIRDQRIDSELARRKTPLVQHNEILDCNTMTIAVKVRGVCIAHVMMMERGRSFSDLDRDVLTRLGGFVGQEMQKGEVWGPTTGEMGSFFLANLLADNNPSEAVTARRMKALNFHPKAEFFVACLHAEGEGLSQSQAERVAAQLRPVLHHSLYTRYHQQLVVLFSRDVGEGLASFTEPKLHEVAVLNELSVGISNSFTRISEARAAYAQARTAVRLGQMASSVLDDQGLFHYCDYAYMHVLELTNRRANLLSFCHPALLRLQAHDERHGGELMDTLFCYLQVNGVTKHAAEMLSFHKNTMLYRMGRIREILGLDLSSGEVLFQLQLSFRVLMYLGLFTPRVHMSRDELGS